MSIKNSDHTYIIMSAERPENGIRRNIELTEELQDLLTEHGFTKVDRASGLWNGVREVSLVIQLLDYEKDMEILKEIAAQFQQDAILEVKQGHGWLHYLTHAPKQVWTERYAGTMTYLDKGTVAGRNDFTELGNGLRFRIE